MTATREVKPGNGVRFTLKELQNLVADGGLIEMMTLDDDTILVFDEEGKLKGESGKPYNEEATDLVVSFATIDSYGEPGTFSADLQQGRNWIAGDVLVCSSEELEK